MGEEDERRGAVRVEVKGLEPGVWCRILPGLEATLVNVSHAGVLVETRWPLAPGRVICLQVAGDRAAYRNVHGRVIRCAVQTLCATRGPVFRAAISVSGSSGPLRELCCHSGQQPD